MLQAPGFRNNSQWNLEVIGMCELFKSLAFRAIHHIDETKPITIHGTIAKRQPHELARANGTATATDMPAKVPMIVI